MQVIGWGGTSPPDDGYVVVSVRAGPMRALLRPFRFFPLLSCLSPRATGERSEEFYGDAKVLLKGLPDG